jgi:hypothetical protein
MRKFRYVLVALALLAPIPALAHHGWSGYSEEEFDVLAGRRRGRAADRVLVTRSACRLVTYSPRLRLRCSGPRCWPRPRQTPMETSRPLY